MGDILDISSIAPIYLEYKLTKDNFTKKVKAHKVFKRQLSAWTKEFKPFVDRTMAKAIKTYENLHARMYDIEERVKNRLKELSIIDFTNFMAEFK